MKSFEGKVAAITGASSGIGRALALELAARGCHLALSSNSNQTALSDTADACACLGVKVTKAKVDVAERGAVHAWAEDVVHDHGRVNLIINNAGVAFGGTVLGSSYEDFEWVMNINFWGVVHGTKAFLPHIVASGEGQVVNISSIFGMISQPGHSPYNASKFAVRGFTESLRQELDLLKNGVGVTCVLPGGVRTNVAASSRFSESYMAVSGATDEASGKADFERLFRTSAEDAAKATLRGVAKNSRRVLIGLDAYAADAMQRALPAAYQNFMRFGLDLFKVAPRKKVAAKKAAVAVAPEAASRLPTLPAKPTAKAELRAESAQ